MAMMQASNNSNNGLLGVSFNLYRNNSHLNSGHVTRCDKQRLSKSDFLQLTKLSLGPPLDKQALPRSTCGGARS